MKVAFTDDDGNDESLTSAATAAVTAAPNNPATGAPGIRGTVQVGETLTADTSPVADADGLNNVSYSYQWIRNDGSSDTDITGANGSSYTLVEADEGRTIKMKVSFTDDADNGETLTSAATGPVQPRPGTPVILGTARVGETLTADTSDVTDPEGMENAVFAYQWIAGGADIEGATGSSYTVAAGDEGLVIQVWVSFTDDGGNPETRSSEGTETVQPPPNTPATGAPTISGTAEVGETLTVDTSGISDADGMANAVYTHRWMAGGTDIQGATGPSYTLTGDDEGLTIQVWMSFTDDAGNPEALTSAATGAVALKEPPLAPGNLTAAVNADGSVTLTWDAPDDDSITGYQVLRRNRETDAKGNFTIIEDDTGTAATTYTDDSVAPATRYGYRVKARNAHGLSPRSRSVRADTPAEPEPTAVTLSLNPDSVGEDAAATPVAVTALLNNSALPTATDVTVSVTGGTATSGTDYAAVSDFTVTIAGGQTSGTAQWSFDPTQDSLAEGDETVILRGSAAGLAAGTATLTITDDDPAPDPTPEPGNDDYSADTSNSGSLGVGETVGGDIEAFGDRDWFAVTLEADRTYQFDQLGSWTGHGTLANPYLRGIHNAEAVAAPDTTDDNSGISSNARVIFTPSDGGTYYVAASSDVFPRSNGAGTYQLTVTDVTDGHPDDYAADTSTDATVEVNGTATGNVEFPGDKDWFAVPLEADETYRLDLKGSRSHVGTLYNPNLGGIYDGDGILLRYTSDNNSGVHLESRVLFTATEAGNYFVEAGGYGNSEEGTYQLKVTKTPDDDFEAHIRTDSTLTVGDTVTGGIDFVGDEDWFAVTLEALQTYLFQQKGSESGHGTLEDPYLLGIYNSSGTLMPGTKDSQGAHLNDNSSVRYAPSLSGTYYLAAGVYGDSEGTYTLSVANVTEPDDYSADSTTTGTVPVGGDVTGKVELAGDNDWFAVILEADKAYRFDLKGTGTNPLQDPYLHGVHDAEGVSEPGAVDDNGGIGQNSRVLFTPSEAGTYYVAAGAAAAGKGAYKLSVVEHIDDYSQDTGTTGVALVGGSITGDIEFPGDRDWFAVTMEAGRSYEFVLNGSWTAHGTLGDPFLRGIYDPNGSSIPGTKNNNYGSSPNSRVVYVAVVDGTHYVSVGASVGQGTYTLWVEDYTVWQ